MCRQEYKVITYMENTVHACYKKGYMRHKCTTAGSVPFPSYAGQVISLEIAHPPHCYPTEHDSTKHAYLDNVGFCLLVHVRVFLSKKNNTQPV
jgi:hypothetical protein